MYLRKILVINILLFFSCSKTNIIEVDKMEIVEILSQITPYVATFTVNTAVQSVMVDVGGGGGLSGNLRNADGKRQIVAGDNFEILSIGYSLPMGYEVLKNSNFGVESCVACVLGCKSGGVITYFGVPSSYYMPLSNYEFAIGKFINKIVLKNSELFASFAPTVHISMVNVPSSFNGAVVSVPIFVKIKHNKEMI